MLPRTIPTALVNCLSGTDLASRIGEYRLTVGRGQVGLAAVN